MVDYHGGAIGELRYQLQRAAHALDIAPQGREQHIAALFQARNRILPDTQRRGKIFLGLLDGLPQFFQSGKLLRTLFDFGAPLLRAAPPSHHRVFFAMFVILSFPAAASASEMIIKTIIRYRNQPLVKALLVGSNLCRRLRVESLAFAGQMKMRFATLSLPN